MVEKTLIPAKEYLQAGIHIGAKFKTEGMRRFIFKKRPDKLKVLDISTIDERIKVASKFLASFPAEKLVVVSQKEYGRVPASKFAEHIGAKAFTGRFVPGTFTNPESKRFIEPAVVLITDPNVDRQAVKEAAEQHVPIVALCSTDNKTEYIDLIIPCNNKGRKSLALVYWLLAREILKARESIKKDKEFSAKIDDFEFKAPALGK
ncbi:MAG: 30S ribosomal protein S2 [Candidatus Diapherotrites archaeon]|uniref:Small ribosomal subunit protein uS2 n=1 Tax=Candidatus Iainarchaeum sp. TaxID=3101447 RepID=A0A497JFB1_9ARCH|nr:30S ribosomal protein S2 [Candidatus Diapherotrites archaeon]RLG69472.1 MAG: 30S ribosomal protein S2 [Candidatus Diapherotrites archaeon]